MEDALRALRKAAPPDETDAQRGAQIAQTLSEAQKLGQQVPPQRSMRARLLWGGLVGGIAATAGVLLWITTQSISAPRTTKSGRANAMLISGELHSANAGVKEAGQELPMEHAFVAASDARIALADHSAAELRAGTEFSIARVKGWHIEISNGGARFDVTGQPGNQPFEVVAPHVAVRVVGTRFDVIVCDFGETAVTVAEGTVEVQPLNGEMRYRLTAGEGARFSPRARTSAGRECEREQSYEHEPDAGGPPLVLRGEARSARRSPRLQAPPVTRIRTYIRRGQVDSARKLIDQGRASPNRAYLAELAIVEAEADLAEGLRNKAIVRYREVHRTFPGTPQAEAALFAAAQLSLDVDTDAARHLLDIYLRTYPAGRFADDAEKLLGVLDGR